MTRTVARAVKKWLQSTCLEAVIKQASFFLACSCLFDLRILMLHPRNSNLYRWFLDAASGKLHLPTLIQRAVMKEFDRLFISLQFLMPQQAINR